MHWKKKSLTALVLLWRAEVVGPTGSPLATREKDKPNGYAGMDRGSRID